MKKHTYSNVTNIIAQVTNIIAQAADIHHMKLLQVIAQESHCYGTKAVKRSHQQSRTHYPCLH